MKNDILQEAKRTLEVIDVKECEFDQWYRRTTSTGQTLEFRITQ
jgi:hypothetical protein